MLGSLFELRHFLSRTDFRQLLSYSQHLQLAQQLAARRFVDWLTESEPNLTGVDYLVLGCGSLDWAATYQRIPTRIDDAMAHAGLI